MNDYVLDYIVIGGGIAGLYANYKLSAKYKGLLLEKNNYLGGRAQEINFHGTPIKLGAGIIIQSNHQLLKLLKKLDLKPTSFSSFVDTYNINTTDFNMDKAISDITDKYKQEKQNIIKSKMTMKEFLVKYFGTSMTNQFILNCQYHDFLKSDVEYFMEYYNINDMSQKESKLSSIQWTDLVNKLVKKNCLSNANVISITKTGDMFSVRTDINYYLCKKVIFATTLKPIVKLSKNITDINYNDHLGAVHFARIYCYYKNGYKSDLTHYTIVSNKLQKVLTINDNIVMAAYCDGNNALFWKKVKELKKKEQIEIVSDYLKEVNIEGVINDIVIVYWEEGVHYYKPTTDLEKTINLVSNPAPNVYAVGDMVSYKQGWVEGCIESVNRTLKILF
jgi:monoamine oxidase